MSGDFWKIFDELNLARETGNLNDYLESVSPEKLLLFDRKDNLLHDTHERRIILKLVSVGVDINKLGNLYNDTPLMRRLASSHTDTVAFMIALGSNLSIKTPSNITHLDIALGEWPLYFYYNINEIMRFENAKCLISNGSRLANMNETILRQSPHRSLLILFEKGVMNCRDVIVTLLGLKRRKAILPHLDRFLIKQVLAVEIWSTRSVFNETQTTF